MIFICFAEIVKLLIFILIFNIHETMPSINHMLLTSSLILKHLTAEQT
jgi:hypothetical protein